MIRIKKQRFVLNGIVVMLSNSKHQSQIKLVRIRVHHPYSKVWTELGGYNYKAQHPFSSYAAVERLFSIDAAIHVAKRASFTSRNFHRLVFLKRNFDCMKLQRFAQNYFDDMPSTSSK